MSIDSLVRSNLATRRDIHPGYLLIDLGQKFEYLKEQRIMEIDTRNNAALDQLKILNRAHTTMLSLRKQNEVGEGELHEVFGDLNREFPELHFDDFMQKYATYTPGEWDMACESISSKEKFLMLPLNQSFKDLEPEMLDQKKVCDIISEILKKLSEADEYAVKQQTRGG
ncbi:MAG: hypothetical protein ACHQT8_06380 [Chlamydiales bacterium]